MNIIDVDEAVRRLKAGEMIIVTDDHARENEGDVVVLADRIETRHVDFMTRHARGLICTAISHDIARRLELRPMTEANTSLHGTAFTLSVDAANGGTGISVSDRTETMRRLASKESCPSDFGLPGHIFPIVAKEAGLFEREGHTEAAVALARLCGAVEAAAICEVCSDCTNDMAAGAELRSFAEKHGLGILSIAELKTYLLRQSNGYDRVKHEIVKGVKA
jgi:3,4-dihydroxy 2-butanone 4-phosphate synthase/GTP cyclohydrolase II